MGKPIYKFLGELRAFAIVIKDNPKSEFYFSKIDPVWDEVGVVLERFDAWTPSTMPDTIKFHRNEANKYKHLPEQSKPFTDTEKACWYSHHSLWQKCAALGEPIVIVEHDCVPFYPHALYHSNKQWFRTYDKGAMGCYVMTPMMADFICGLTKRDGVYSGPLGHIEYWYKQFASKAGFYSGERAVGPWLLDRHIIGCTQIMDSRFGGTIEHYSGTGIDPDKDLAVKPFPFLMIDNLPDKLTLEIIQLQRHKYDYMNKVLEQKKSPEGL